MSQRLIVAIVLVPLGVFFVAAGGWIYAILILLMLGYGAWEYWRLFESGGYHPTASVLIVGVLALVAARRLLGFTGSGLILGVAVMVAMAVQVFAFEKGETASAIDFNITLGGILYLGWMGAYLISLRELKDGLWWIMTVFPAVWIGDGAAYFIGSHFGKHKMSKRVSPNKSWEGYAAGVIFGALGAMLLASLWHLRAPDITAWKGLVTGLIITAIVPLGDFGESMLKRGFGVKDTSHLLPGHGGVMDRIDSWLWAAVIGYYLITYAWV